jgi:hypothetical protein
MRIDDKNIPSGSSNTTTKNVQDDFTHRQKFELDTIRIRSKMLITVDHRIRFLDSGAIGKNAKWLFCPSTVQ